MNNKKEMRIKTKASKQQNQHYILLLIWDRMDDFLTSDLVDLTMEFKLIFCDVKKGSSRLLKSA